MIKFIDKDLIDQTDAGIPIRQALATLALEGFWSTQTQKLWHDLYQGNINEPESALAIRILDVRKRVAHYQELQALGLEFSKGQSNA